MIRTGYAHCVLRMLRSAPRLHSGPCFARPEHRLCGALLFRGPHAASVGPGPAEQRCRTMRCIAQAAPRPGHGRGRFEQDSSSGKHAVRSARFGIAAADYALRRAGATSTVEMIFAYHRAEGAMVRQSIGVLRIARRYKSTTDSPDMSNVFAPPLKASCQPTATLHGVVFHILRWERRWHRPSRTMRGSQRVQVARADLSAPPPRPRHRRRSRR